MLRHSSRTCARICEKKMNSGEGTVNGDKITAAHRKNSFQRIARVVAAFKFFSGVSSPSHPERSICAQKLFNRNLSVFIDPPFIFLPPLYCRSSGYIGMCFKKTMLNSSDRQAHTSVLSVPYLSLNFFPLNVSEKIVIVAFTIK